jgi:hypothetical protein
MEKDSKFKAEQIKKCSILEHELRQCIIFLFLPVQETRKAP